jgi:PAT family beta-lactamase induction signal transducer AmpG
MSTARKIPALWILSFPVISLGILFGFTVVTLPQMLAAQGVPGGYIAEAVAVITSPTFWGFLIGPVLDVRFRRRTWAIALALIAALAVGFTVLHHSTLWMVEAVMLIAFFAISLYSFAVGGWTGSLIRKDQDSRLGAWNTVFNIGGGSIGLLLNGFLSLRLSPLHLAALIAAEILLPLMVFVLIPAPPPDNTLVGESFSRFFREVLSLFRRREVLIALPLFLLPSASFALTNTLGGWGEAFHAAPTFVSTVAAIAGVLSGITGPAVVPMLAKRFFLRPLYLSIGCFGALFTLSLILLPRAPWTFGLAFYGETALQAAAIATSIGIIYEIIGPENPLASTTYGLLFSASNLPIVYMEVVDGHGYDWHGVAGAFLADALLSIAACTFLAVVLRKWLFASPQEVTEHA